MKLEMFPLLAFSFVVYAALTFVVPVNAAGEAWHQLALVTLPLYSSDPWTIRWGDLFLIGSMALLFVELVRATHTGTASITNHLLSFLLFIAVLLCFILVKGFGNSTFFIFLTMTLLDPMAGFIVTTVSARRDLGVVDKSSLIS